MNRLPSLLLLLLAILPASAQLDRNSHLAMMRHTVLISAPDAAPGTFAGAGFIIGRPLKFDSRKFLSILVTATSVFEQVTNQNIHFTLRYETNSSWNEMLIEMPVRSAQGTQLWTSHPSAGIAAIVAPIYYDAFPNRTLISTSRLLTDDMIKQYNVGPGDDIYCLWFGLGIQNTFKFPLLREGRIASFPLSPMKDTAAWAVDFQGFKGNLGSPLYMLKQGATDASRRYAGNLFAIAGLVTRANPLLNPADTAALHKDSGLLVISPASFIQETIDSVPDPDPTQPLQYQMRPLNP